MTLPPKFIPNLFDMWVREYHEVQFTQHMVNDIKRKLNHGSFAQSLVDGDVNEAFAHADPSNLRMLERLLGCTKHQVGEAWWDWPHDLNSKGECTEV